MKSNGKYLIIALLAIVAGFSACGNKVKSSEKDILEFWVGDVKYNINGTNITYLYTKASENSWDGWISMPAAPSKVEFSPGASIEPPVTDRQNFENEVEYTVTAEDGSTKTYKVKVDRTQYLD